MKKTLGAVVGLTILLIGTAGWSLAIYDPNDRVYTYLSIWEEKRYFAPLPMVRPYPPQLVKVSLQEVIRKGGELDRQIAEGFISELEGEGSPLALRPGGESLLLIGLDVSLECFLTTSPADAFLRPAAQVALSGGISPNIQFSGIAGVWAYDKSESDFIPYRTEGTVFYSGGGGASLRLGNTTFSLASLWKGGLFLGSDTLYFQTGLMRSSFGPFFETGAVLGPQAPEAGTYSFTWRGDWFSISSLLLQLNASTGVGSGEASTESPIAVPYGTLYSLKGTTTFFPSKFLILHSASLNPFPWLTLGLMQSTVFGGRLDTLYLLPFAVLADSQIWEGDWDNSLMGVFAQMRLRWNLKANLSLYVDDFNSDEALKLNFNSGQDKVALQVGITWTPELPVLFRLSAEYLLITPYMYTHNRFLYLSYLNYTNFDRHLGSVLDPNSDQLIVRAELQAFLWMFNDLWIRVSRHGNGSDHGNGTVAGDGSIWDDGNAQNGDQTYWGSSTFLTQRILEWIFQIGTGVEVRLPFKWPDLWLRGEYTFELVTNRGLVEGADTINNYLKLTLRVGF